jgi:hypothetical protein
MYEFLLQEAEMKSNYILKRERLAPDLAKLQMFYDYHLSIESEMVKALMRAGMYGNHGGKKDDTGTVAKRGDRQVDGSDSEGTSATQTSSEEMH